MVLFSFKVSFSLPLKSESCRVIFPAIRSTNSQTERCRTQATHPAGKWYWGTLAQFPPVPSTGLAICLSFWTKSSALDATLALTKDGLSQTKEAYVSISIFNTWLLSEGFRKPHVIPFRQNSYRCGMTTRCLANSFISHSTAGHRPTCIPLRNPTCLRNDFHA